MVMNIDRLEAIIIAERNGILSKRKALRLVSEEIDFRRQLEAMGDQWFIAKESSKK